MSKDAFTPRTTDQRLPLPLNGTIYTTTRLVAPEKTTPEVGATMAAELGAAWADSIIISVMTQPQNSQEVLVIQHARIPSETAQLASNWEQVEVPIGGKSYPGVIRTVILPAASYQDAAPATGSAMPVITAGLFAGDGYTLFERNSSKIGSPLEPVFRIDRRTYIIPRAFSGEEYGDIVTKSVEETIVSEATAGDTGINIISSVVDPIGKGLAIKTTKSAKGGWPAPVEEEIVSDGTRQPPARYLRDLIRTTVKKMVSAVGSSTLTGNEVSKSYKRETPDRVAETTTTETLNLTLTAIDSSVQQKPFVTITEVMTPGPAKVLPPNRSGSAKLVYEQGTTQIWENTEEVAVAREGSAGKDKDKKPFVSIVTDKRYSTSDSIATSSGGANIVFNDGTTRVYEISEITSTGRYGDAGAEQQVKPFVKITSTKSYEETGILGEGEVGGSNKIYDDGDTVVYEKSVETAVARPGPAGTEKDEKPFVKIETAKKYAATSDISTKTGSANVVFNDGNVQVYEVSEVTSTGKFGPAGAEQQTKPFVKITSDKSYQDDGFLSASEVGSTNKIYDDGTTVVYEKSVETAVAREGPAGTEKDEKPFVKLTTNKKYDTSPEVSTPTGASNVVFNDGNVQVYEVSEVTATPKTGPAGVEKEQRLGYRLEHTDTYDSDSNITDGIGESVIAYADGAVTVWKKRTTRVVALNTSLVVDKKRTKFYERVVTAEYSTSPTSAEDIYTAEVVFSDGTVTIYKIESVKVTPLNSHTYDSYVRADRPSELINFAWSEVQKKDEWLQAHNDRDLYLIRPNIKEGYSGMFPAKITEYFTTDGNVANTFDPVIFLPEPIHYDGLKFNVSVGPTLHDTVELLDAISEIAAGNTPDPMYPYGAGPVEAYRTFDATVPTEVPSGYVDFTIDVEPFENGFIIREVKVKYKD